MSRSARQGSGALDLMASRSGAMQQVFTGTRLAAQGNVSALFNVARAMRAVLASGGPLTIILMVVAALLAIGSAAWSRYQKRQKEAADSAKEATEKLAAAQKRLSDVIAASKAPSYEPQVKALQEIATAYSEAEEAAKNYKNTQDQVAAAQAATKVAGIQETAQRAIGAAAGDEELQAVIDFNAKRATALATYDAEYVAIQRNAKAQEEHLARLKTTLNALALQSMKEMAFSTPLKEAEKAISDIKAKSHKEFLATGKGPSAETKEAMAAAISERDRLKAESEKAQEQRDKQTREAQAARAAAEQSLAATPEKKAQLAAEFSAQEAAANAAEKTRVAALDKLQAERNILKTKEEIRKQAEAETEAVKQAGEARAEQFEDEKAMTAIEKERAETQVEKLTARVLSPAARQAQDEQERAAKKEEERIEKRIASAEAKRKLGVTGKWIDEALALKGARQEAAAKQAELNRMEQDRTVAARESRDALENIEQMLLKNLQAVS